MTLESNVKFFIINSLKLTKSENSVLIALFQFIYLEWTSEDQIGLTYFNQLSYLTESEIASVGPKVFANIDEPARHHFSVNCSIFKKQTDVHLKTCFER